MTSLPLGFCWLKRKIKVVAEYCLSGYSKPITDWLQHLAESRSGTFPQITFDFSDIGEYFSALSNEANLKGRPFAWLIFGVENKNFLVVGSRFREKRKDLDSLKNEVANKTTNRITFVEIHELRLPEGRVVMFQIPAAPRGIPVAFEEHYYGRGGESLVPLNIEEIERIRTQAGMDDWSAGVISDATLDDLDPKAIEVSRTNYKSKYSNKTAEVDLWDDVTFLKTG